MEERPAVVMHGATAMWPVAASSVGPRCCCMLPAGQLMSAQGGVVQGMGSCWCLRQSCQLLRVYVCVSTSTLCVAVCLLV